MAPSPLTGKSFRMQFQKTIMNPLNLQLCNIPLPSQLIDTPQQEASPKRGHLFNSPIDSIQWACCVLQARSVLQQSSSLLPKHIPTTTPFMKRSQNPSFHPIPTSSSFPDDWTKLTQAYLLFCLSVWTGGSRWHCHVKEGSTSYLLVSC